MKKAICVILLTIVLLAGFIVAENCPPAGPPKIYSGTISVNQTSLTGTYNLYAMMGNERVGEIQFSGGSYSNLQVSPCSGVSGEIIFSVNGIEANEKAYYSGTQDEWGEEVILNLTLNKMPPTQNTCGDQAIQLGEECDGINLGGRSLNSCGSGWTGTISCSSTCEIDYSNCTLTSYCGDGTCNNGETCSTCSNDCGACPSGGGSGGGGSSGGGGGGGSSAKKTTPSNNTLVPNNTIFLSTINSGEESNEEITEENSNGITGNAISNFTKSKTGKVILIAVLLIAALGLIISFKNKKTVKKEVKVVKLSELKNRKK